MPPAAKTKPLPAAPSSPSAKASPTSSPSSAPKGTATRSAATEGAGIFLALVLYPVLVNFLNGGPKQVAGWIKAKWINVPYQGGAGSKSHAPIATRAPTPSGFNTTPPPIWNVS